MESKLHIFDATGLKNYRLVHESVPNQNVNGGAQEVQYKQVYNVLINPKNPIPAENTGYVKIFERVDGTKIIGYSLPDSIVTISNTIRTNINRTFIYSQKTITNNEGKYTFTVPYSTTGFIQNETKFDTSPIDKYEIILINKIIKIDVREEDVLNGNTIII